MSHTWLCLILFSREEVRNPLEEEPKKEKGTEEEETYEDVILLGEWLNFLTEMVIYTEEEGNYRLKHKSKNHFDSGRVDNYLYILYPIHTSKTCFVKLVFIEWKL